MVRNIFRGIYRWTASKRRVFMRVRCVLSLGFLAMVSVNWTTPARSQLTDSVTTRIDRLESELAALRARQEKLQKELGVEGKSGMVVVKPAGREPTLRLGGLLQPQVEFGDRGDRRFSDDNDRFFLRR